MNRLQVILETVTQILSEADPKIWLSSVKAGRPKGETGKAGLTKAKRNELVQLAMALQKGKVRPPEGETPHGILKSAAERMMG